MVVVFFPWKLGFQERGGSFGGMLMDWVFCLAVLQLEAQDLELCLVNELHHLGS